ncbi:MAG: AAA family ATPase [Bacteroidota bacterium]|nr:AAA family ATPase [Bacteroidota bacterium]
MDKLKKFVVIGPESTGKSTLCSKLSAHFQTLWAPEYAREYLETHGKEYVFEDLLRIAQGQIALEEDFIRRSNPLKGPLFVDTDMYVMKVWCEFVFQRCHSWILNTIASRSYDGYLLCNVDLPWVPDALREYPDESIRRLLYRHYKEILVNQSTPWVEISGGYRQREEKAIEFVHSIWK